MASMMRLLPSVARRRYPPDMGCQFIRGSVVRGGQPGFCDEPRAGPSSPYCILHVLVCFEAPAEARPDAGAPSAAT